MFLASNSLLDHFSFAYENSQFFSFIHCLNILTVIPEKRFKKLKSLLLLKKQNVSRCNLNWNDNRRFWGNIPQHEEDSVLV